MKRPLGWAAAHLGLTIGTDREITGWSIDSRTLSPGDLFFALRGPNHDGRKYVAEVLRRGAAGAVVDGDVEAEGPVLRVDDSLTALQQLAAKVRREWAGEVVGVTGSAGKTTTKDVIAPYENSQDAAWTPGGVLVMAANQTIAMWRSGRTEWMPLAILGPNSPYASGAAQPAVRSVTRLAVSPDSKWLAFVAEPAK